MFKTESYRKGIIYSVFFNFIARGIAFLNALAIAFYFGNNNTTDLYFYILSFVTIVTGFINGMDTFVLIPESMRLRHQESETASMQFLKLRQIEILVLPEAAGAEGSSGAHQTNCDYECNQCDDEESHRSSPSFLQRSPQHGCCHSLVPYRCSTSGRAWS